MCEWQVKLCNPSLTRVNLRTLEMGVALFIMCYKLMSCLLDFNIFFFIDIFHVLSQCNQQVASPVASQRHFQLNDGLVCLPVIHLLPWNKYCWLGYSLQECSSAYNSCSSRDKVLSSRDSYYIQKNMPITKVPVLWVIVQQSVLSYCWLFETLPEVIVKSGYNHKQPFCYSVPQCLHCRHCTSHDNSVHLSVRPSVCHTPLLCQNDCTQHGAVCTVRQQNVSTFVETKKYSPGMTPSPEILARTDLPPPDSSES